VKESVDMIQINNLVKNYGSIQAVKGVSFHVKKGEILGFLGPNGAGKSTTMNILTGYIPCTSGTVLIDGHDILEEPEVAKSCIGYLPEQPPLFMDLTVKEYLNFVYDLKKVKGLDRKEHISKICDLVGITHVYNRLINNLSKGYKQRVGLAQALIGNPKVLILDEPTVGLDPSQIIEIRKLIKSLSKEHTIILSTHILPEVSAVCDRVIIINNGEIAAEDTTSNLASNITKSPKYSILIAGSRNAATKVLEHVQGVSNVRVSKKGDDINEFTFQMSEGIDARKMIFFDLAKAGLPIMELKPLDATLEDIFMKVISMKEE